MSKRTCYNCDKPIPSETKHFILQDEPYCTECVDMHSYTAYMFYVDGEFMGLSEEECNRQVEEYEDEYYDEEESN